MTAEPSASLVALLLGVAFAGGFALLLFVLWAKDKSPVIKGLGETVGALFQAAVWSSLFFGQPPGNPVAGLIAAGSGLAAAVALYRTFQAWRLAGQQAQP